MIYPTKDAASSPSRYKKMKKRLAHEFRGDCGRAFVVLSAVGIDA
jgi:hypothetical protein